MLGTVTGEPTVEAVLRRVLEVIRERGWTTSWSVGPGTPLNLRSAISVACTDVAGGPAAQWHHLYLDTVDILMQHLHNGILYWEYTAKSQAKVERMLTDVIARLESDEIHPRRRDRGRNNPL